MSRRNRKYQQDKKKSILDIALDVYQTKTGSATRSAKEQQTDIKYLGHVLETWHWNGADDHVPERPRIDHQIYKLIETIYEFAKYR